jgi:hypothetical protein
MQTAVDDRTEMLKSAIAACFAQRLPVTPTNVSAKLPPDFFVNFDTGKPLEDTEVFAEIQATYNAAAKPAAVAIEDNAHVEFDEGGIVVPVPDTVAVPVAETTAAPVPIESTPSHAATGPGQLSPQVRLDAARLREGNLLAEQRQLQNAVRGAREQLQEAKIAYAACDPHRETPAMLSASFRKASQEQRAARKRGEKWATPPEARAGGEIAHVDLARKYQRSQDGNSFARRSNRYGDTRGAYSKVESQGGQAINRDTSRGSVPKAIAPPRSTIPALAKP